MTQPNLVQLAQSGDGDAIAALMNASLRAIGIRARVVIREGNLHVLLESETALDQHPCIEFIRKGIVRLGVVWPSAFVYSRVTGQTAPIWIQRIDLAHTEAANPFVLPPDADVEVFNWKTLFSGWKGGRLFDLLWLSIPLLVVLSSLYIWSKYLSGGVSSPIGQLLAPAAVKINADPFEAAFQRAKNAARLSQSAKVRERQEWQAIAQEWRQAIALLKTVPLAHPKYAIAQQKLQEYQRTVDYLMKDKLGDTSGMALKKVISDGISPKSILHAGDLFFAANGPYRHSVTVYNRDYALVKTLSDQVTLADYGYSKFKGTQRGSPVAAAAETDQFIWVANAQMSGEGFTEASIDGCSPAQTTDPGFLYRVNTQSWTIDHVVRVGSVPQAVAASPNQRVLVSNWCSWDVSVIDTQTRQEIRRIQVGPYPRGIAIDAKSEIAYVAVSGASAIAAINLRDFSVGWLRGVGRSPHHLMLDPPGRYLYTTLAGEGQVVKIDVSTGTIVGKVNTGSAPRSMALSEDGQTLYVVNYHSNTVSKVRTQEMQVTQTVEVNPAPIGITYDPKTRQVWVACYSGSILVFQD